MDNANKARAFLILVFMGGMLYIGYKIFDSIPSTIKCNSIACQINFTDCSDCVGPKKGEVIRPNRHVYNNEDNNKENSMPEDWNVTLELEQHEWEGTNVIGDFFSVQIEDED